jgi:hypothetical protein
MEVRALAASDGEDKVALRRSLEQTKEYNVDKYFTWQPSINEWVPSGAGIPVLGVDSNKVPYWEFPDGQGYLSRSIARPDLLRRGTLIIKIWWYQVVVDANAVRILANMQGFSEGTDPLSGVAGLGSPTATDITMLSNADKVGLTTFATTGVIDFADHDCLNLRIFRNGGADSSTQPWRYLASEWKFYQRNEE